MFTEQPPSNEGVGVPETNPLAQIFSEEYSFGARIYDIENNPGSAAPTSGIPTEAPTEFPPAEQEPTPAALVPGNPGADEAWFVWSGVSPIQISIPSGADVRSIYISGNLSGQTIYVTSGYTAGGFMTVSPGYSKDMIPIPPGSPLLTLYVANFAPNGFDNPIYVCAYGGVWNPFDQGGGLGTLIWVDSPTLGSGQVYTNETANVQLITAGGTSAQAYINGVAVSGGQPGTYTLNPGDSIYFVFGLDLTILTMSNLTHYYPMETLSGTETPDLVLSGNTPGNFYSLVTSPPDWTPPKLAPSITSDNAPSLEANTPVITIYNPGTGSQRGTAFGWGLSASSGFTGPQSWLFFFKTSGMFPWDAGPTNPPNLYHDMMLVRPVNTGPALLLSYANTTSGDFSYAVEGRGTSEIASWTINEPPLFETHMCVVTWDGTSVLTLQFDLQSPISVTITGFAQNPPAFDQPSFFGDDNGEAPCQMSMAKLAVFNTVIASQVIQEIYEQGTNSVNPIFQLYQVLGTS